MGKVEKFEESTIRNGSKPIYYEEDADGCVNCKSHRLDRDGYGRIDRAGREWLMHRYIYTITYQIIIPPKMEVMHLCDNPICMNPEHLEMGTHEENMLHKKLRNRPLKRGLRLAVQEQKELAESGLTILQLALKYNVSHSTIVKAKAKNRIKSERKRAGDKPSIPNKTKTKQKNTSQK